jgi:hypothetical protein
VGRRFAEGSASRMKRQGLSRRRFAAATADDLFLL